MALICVCVWGWLMQALVPSFFVPFSFPLCNMGGLCSGAGERGSRRGLPSAGQLPAEGEPVDEMPSSRSPGVDAPGKGVCPLLPGLVAWACWPSWGSCMAGWCGWAVGPKHFVTAREHLRSCLRMLATNRRVFTNTHPNFCLLPTGPWRIFFRKQFPPALRAPTKKIR